MKKITSTLLALLLLAGLAAAQVKAVRVSPGPKIDGKLDDVAWQAAKAHTDFRMVEPTPGQDPTERTELRVVYDDTNIYIGILCRDREPKRIVANTMAHDGGGSGGQMYGNYHRSSSASNDQVQILLDPFLDKRTAYVFTINPKGGRGEGLVYAGSTSLNWDGIWDAAAEVNDEGWSAEMRIPFKTLSFKPGLTTWGINLERAIPRKQETIRLSGLTRDANFSNPNEAASLEGIENVRQGLGLTFRPYALGVRDKDYAAGTSASLSGDAGFDIYKSITPNLVAVASYNMDFAETEADERRINLTRFPMFFPEKRMFFLEGSENFSFSSSVSFTPFFSRTVGLLGGE
ncbi:MAG: carbohydrate binding family 9 domain-containing protein, partial [Acidobacteriota bacterium]|nr:carbohydrate binding family 9 domain-containing protein [Acidobacteriota bacterium]